jgi:hypothetical protein
MVTSKHGPSIANIETSSVAAQLPSVPKMFIPFNSLGLEMEYVIRPWGQKAELANFSNACEAFGH